MGGPGEGGRAVGGGGGEGLGLLCLGGATREGGFFCRGERAGLLCGGGLCRGGAPVVGGRLRGRELALIGDLSCRQRLLARLALALGVGADTLPPLTAPPRPPPPPRRP